MVSVKDPDGSRSFAFPKLRPHRIGFSLAFLTFLVPSTASAENGLSSGLGLRYWKTVDQIDVSDRASKEQGVSIVLSLQRYLAKYAKVQLDVELATKGFGGFKSDDPVLLGQGYILFGSWIYGGIGVGMAGLWACGTEPERDSKEPFYGGRVGLEFELTPNTKLDLNGTYLINAFDELGEEETDAFTIGAVIRFDIEDLWAD